MFPAAICLHRAPEIGETEVDGPENIIRKSVSLYTGWLTAASAISATTLVQEAGYFKKAEDASKWTLLALPALYGLGKIVSNRLNDPYLLTLIATLAGIAAKQKDDQKEVSALAASLAVALLGEAGNRLRLQHDIA